MSLTSLFVCLSEIKYAKATRSFCAHVSLSSGFCRFRRRYPAVARGFVQPFVDCGGRRRSLALFNYSAFFRHYFGRNLSVHREESVCLAPSISGGHQQSSPAVLAARTSCLCRPSPCIRVEQSIPTERGAVLGLLLRALGALVPHSEYQLCL